MGVSPCFKRIRVRVRVGIVQYVQAEYTTCYGSPSTIVIPLGFIVWFPHVHNHQQQVDMSRIAPLGKPSAFFSFLGITEISQACKFCIQWIRLRENLQETMVFPMKYRVPVNVPLNQSIE